MLPRHCMTSFMEQNNTPLPGKTRDIARGTPMMHKPRETFRPIEYLGCIALTLSVMILCICVGSVNVSVRDTISAIADTVLGRPIAQENLQSIIVFVRVPRVLCVALAGAALSLCGAAMQGLLRNPLADGSTLGISSGASLGAAISIAFGLTIPGIPLAGTMVFAILFAFFSMVIILSLTYRLDYSLSTNTIILLGVVFSMFANSILNFIMTFSGEKLRSITFWTMGSLSGSNYTHVLILLTALLLLGGILLRYRRELNAFAIGEDNARHIGVPVKRVKLMIMITVAALLGICVSIGGTIGFVGLIIPHITRMLTGPNHNRLLPAAIFFGASFLMLCDLIGRILLRPLELPIGVVTSFFGSIAFVFIFHRTRRIK